MARNCLPLSLVLVMIFSFFACAPAPETTTMAEEEVIFSDPYLERAIRRAIDKDKGPIYISELEAIISFSLTFSTTADLTGLEYCTNLTELDLRKNQINDISPLVENSGLSEGDIIILTNNPLSETSKEIYIPELQERGVKVDVR